jgi:hypothetical protein
MTTWAIDKIILKLQLGKSLDEPKVSLIKPKDKSSNDLTFYATSKSEERSCLKTSRRAKRMGKSA